MQKILSNQNCCFLRKE